jgi:hypothetical protein
MLPVRFMSNGMKHVTYDKILLLMNLQTLQQERGKYYFVNSAKNFKKSLPILQKCN